MECCSERFTSPGVWATRKGGGGWPGSMKNNSRRVSGKRGSEMKTRSNGDRMLGVGDLAVGSAKSRAAARVMAERMVSEQAKKGSRPGADPGQALVVEIELVGTGRVRRTGYAPPTG